MEKLYTLKNAAKLLAVSPDTLRKWHYQGALPFVKIGPHNIDILGRDRRIIRVKESDIKELMTEV